jgi:ABC-type phosphate/phosphonate transport system substrate-binding protein
MAGWLTFRDRRSPLASGLCAALAFTFAGCDGKPIPLLKLSDDEARPLQLGIVADRRCEPLENPLDLFFPFESFEPLRAALGRELGRPVDFGLCFLFTADEYLCDGLFDLAILSPVQYANLPDRERFPVLALARDKHGRTVASGLLVVAGGGEIRSVADLRGKVVAFGPPRDSRTHCAALRRLAELGIRPADLAPSPLPARGALKTLPGSQEVACSVLEGSSHAGWIDEGYWEGLPESAAEAQGPSRVTLRVIDRTIAIPELLVVGSSRLDASTRRRIEGFLYTLGNRQPEVLRPLGLSGFEPPGEEVLAACARLAGAMVP